MCESAAIVAILRAFGPGRVMWGSDFPVSVMRGRAVTVGDGFVWIRDETLDWESSHVQANPTLVGLESLRAHREVADIAGLSREDVADIFCHNARRLLGIEG